MSLLFIPLGIISLFVVIAIAILTLLVFGLIGLALFFALEKIGAIIAIVAGSIVFVLALTLFLSVFSTFSEVAWVLFFHVIASPKEKEQVKETLPETKEKISALANPDTIKTVEAETKE